MHFCFQSDGVGRSGTFCAIMISVNQFKAEQKVDIFQIIKIIRTQRPGSVTNAVSYIAAYYFYLLNVFYYRISLSSFMMH